MDAPLAYIHDIIDSKHHMSLSMENIGIFTLRLFLSVTNNSRCVLDGFSYKETCDVLLYSDHTNFIGITYI